MLSVHDALCWQHWRLRSGSTADVFPRKAKLLEGWEPGRAGVRRPCFESYKQWKRCQLLNLIEMTASTQCLHSLLIGRFAWCLAGAVTQTRMTGTVEAFTKLGRVHVVIYRALKLRGSK